MSLPVLKIIPSQKRIAVIRKAAAAAKKRASVPFRGKYVPMPVVPVPIGLLIYRAGNGRLGVLEASYTREHALAAGYFLESQESSDVQGLLHGFLSALAARPDGPIKEELRRAALQVEPLLITVEGVVVNGNRRLAAMRDLLAENAEKFAGFATCEVAVLPAEATPADIEFIEAVLQMAPETKLAYGWIDRRLKLRHQRDVLGLPAEDIAEHYRLYDVGQIDKELGELDLVENYLRDFLRSPHDYARVDWAEEPFIQLQQRLGSYKKQKAGVAVKLIGFCLIATAGADEKLRPIKVFPFVDPHPGYLQHMLLHRLGAELGLWPARSDEVRFDAPRASDLMALTATLGDGERAEELAAMVIKVIEDITLEFRNRPSPQIVVQRLRQVTRLATRINRKKLTPTQRDEIATELSRIMGLCALEGDLTSPNPAAGGGVLVNVAHSLEETGKSILRDFRKARK